MSGKQTCETCRYFFVIEIYSKAPNAPGDCRRHAPIFDQSRRKTRFVCVTKDGWCGEWEAKNE